MAIQRDLAAERADASRPDLAAALNNLSMCLWETGRREDALDAIKEAVELLREPFLALPAALASQMEQAVGNYRYCCREVGREIDTDLLTSIREGFELLQDQTGRDG